MGPVESIGQSFRSTCIVSRLTHDGCSVDLAGVPEPRLLIDLDLPGSPLDDQSVRCDYLVFAGDGKRHFLVAPVEFKTKWREKTVKQLQAGADESDRHVPWHSPPHSGLLWRFTASARRRHGDACVRGYPSGGGWSQSEWCCVVRGSARC